MGGSRSVMSGVFGFAAALQLCTRTVTAHGFLTAGISHKLGNMKGVGHASGRSSRLVGGGVANVSRVGSAWFHSNKAAARARTELQRAAHDFPYHYYDDCNHSKTDLLTHTAVQLSESNPIVATHAPILSFARAPTQGSGHGVVRSLAPCARPNERALRERKEAALKLTE